VSITIVGGTGDEGFGLALRLAAGGEDVIIGSRAQEKGETAATNANERLAGRESASTVRGMANIDAVAVSDTVFVTVPFAGQADTYRSIKDSFRANAVVCDCTSPLATAVGGRPWQVITPWQGSAAEQANSLLPESVRLVSAFQTVSGEALQDLDHDLEGDVLVCGGDREAKAIVGALIAKIPNLRWVDAGALSMARVIEPLTAVLVMVNRNYGIRTGGFSVTGRGHWGAPPSKA
jgi:8-hydroxy-5-deazaflavin:NADPH oxidoreductase